jgi:hypothetical protein
MPSSRAEVATPNYQSDGKLIYFYQPGCLALRQQVVFFKSVGLLTGNTNVATVLGSIPASSDIVKSETHQMKQKKGQKYPKIPSFSKKESGKGEERREKIRKGNTRWRTKNKETEEIPKGWNVRRGVRGKSVKKMMKARNMAERIRRRTVWVWTPLWRSEDVL